MAETQKVKKLKGRMERLMVERAERQLVMVTHQQRINEINQELIAAFTELGITKVENDMGLWYYTEGGPTLRFSQDQLKTQLLQQGLTANKIQEIILGCMKAGTTKASMTFRPVREANYDGS